MTGYAPRSVSRQAALQVLYAIDLAAGRKSRSADGATGAEPAVCPGESAPAAVEEAFEAVSGSFELPPAARSFAAELVSGVMERRDALDAIIGEQARNWRLERMAAVDRNVLRLATFELVATETPTSVILDQAIELARRFGDDPSPGFVNGVLAAVAHAVRPREDVVARSVEAGEGS